MRSMSVLILLVLAGCRSRGSCETETGEVADDETDIGDISITAEEALDRAEGTVSLPGEWRSGGAADIVFTLSRGDGPVIFDDGTYTGAFGPFLNPVEVVCVDRLTVPVEVTVTTTDERVDATGEGELLAEHSDGSEEIFLSVAILPDGTLVADADDPVGSLSALFDSSGVTRVQVNFGEEAGDDLFDARPE